MRRKRKINSCEEGYTLLELLVVLVVIALIATLVTTQVFDYLGRARSKAAEIQIQKLSADLDFYRLDTGRYPTTSEGLNALLEPPADDLSWQGPYTGGRQSLLDPWGNQFQYKSPGDHGAYDLYTLGADNAEGGEGEDRDVTNWQEQ